MSDAIEMPVIEVVSRVKRPDGRIDLHYTRSDKPGEGNVILGAPAHLESPEDIWGYIGAYDAINARAAQRLPGVE